MSSFLPPSYENQTAIHPVANAVYMFTAQATSLVDTFDALISPLSSELNIAHENFESVFGKVSLNSESIDGQSLHQMPLTKQTEYIIRRQQFDDAKFAFDIVPRSLLLSLVAIYDHFLRNHIKAVYKIKEELRNKINISFSVPELIDFENLEEVIEFGMERHLDNILRESHFNQLKWFETQLNMTLTTDTGFLPRFIELTERRNMIAHCGGIATPFYIAQCEKQNIIPGAQLGESLNVDKIYFTECYSCIFEIGVKLSQCTWRKIRPDEIQLADHVLRSITYNLLVFEQFELAKNLLIFANGLKKHSSDHFSRIFTVNLAQCYKWLGDSENCRKVLEHKDWTATEPAFILAERVLNDDFEKAKGLMILTGKNKIIPEEAFRDWPLFREFRKTKQFSEAFIEIYNRPFIVTN